MRGLRPGDLAGGPVKLAPRSPARSGPAKLDLRSPAVPSLSKDVGPPPPR
jgi:hypothetical protein